MGGIWEEPGTAVEQLVKGPRAILDRSDLGAEEPVAAFGPVAAIVVRHDDAVMARGVLHRGDDDHILAFRVAGHVVRCYISLLFWNMCLKPLGKSMLGPRVMTMMGERHGAVERRTLTRSRSQTKIVAFGCR